MGELKSMDAVPALGISMKAVIGEKREIVLQTHVERDGKIEELNLVLDKCSAAIQRQDDRDMLAAKRKLLVDETRKLADYEASISNVDEMHRAEHKASGKRGEYQPRGATAAERAKAEANLKNHRLFLQRLKAEIDALEKASK